MPSPCHVDLVLQVTAHRLALDRAAEGAQPASAQARAQQRAAHCQQSQVVRVAAAQLLLRPPHRQHGPGFRRVLAQCGKGPDGAGYGAAAKGRVPALLAQQLRARGAEEGREPGPRRAVAQSSQRVQRLGQRPGGRRVHGRAHLSQQHLDQACRRPEIQLSKGPRDVRYVVRTQVLRSAGQRSAVHLQQRLGRPPRALSRQARHAPQHVHQRGWPQAARPQRALHLRQQRGGRLALHESASACQRPHRAPQLPPCQPWQHPDHSNCQLGKHTAWRLHAHDRECPQYCNHLCGREL
mmetsp:Transcript_33417/g.84689  ORF Transcript_33417/g.84689 Transcript_33417/m.84689 type:complete len:295 (+) Transcript_33417:226-1110(+)